MLNGTKFELLDHRALDISNDELSHAINAINQELGVQPGASGSRPSRLEGPPGAW